jgi:quinol monooxygenase YgiN
MPKNMYITITSSQVKPSQVQEVENFLKNFLPRFRQQPGIVSIYHYHRPEMDDESTIVIWENQASLKAYRESDLIKEAIAFEEKHQLKSTREAYPLIYVSDT